MAALSDEEIVRRLQQSAHPTLFTELVQRHYSRIQQACYRRLKDSEAAKDVSQEVLLRLLSKIRTYRHEAPFSAWLDTIIRNRCTDHLNDSKRSMHRELSSNIIDGLQDALEADDVSIPTPEILADLLDQLRGEEKLLLLLKYQEEWSTHSIQETLQLPEGVVKMRLSRTKDKLRKLLQNRNAKTNT